MVVAHTLIPALRRKKQADLCEFEASLLYIVTRTLQDSQGCYTEKLCLAKLKKKKNMDFFILFVGMNLGIPIMEATNGKASM